MPFSKNMSLALRNEVLLSKTKLSSRTVIKLQDIDIDATSNLSFFRHNVFYFLTVPTQCILKQLCLTSIKSDLNKFNYIFPPKPYLL